MLKPQVVSFPFLLCPPSNFLSWQLSFPVRLLSGERSWQRTSTPRQVRGKRSQWMGAMHLLIGSSPPLLSHGSVAFKKNDVQVEQALLSTFGVFDHGLATPVATET